MKKKFLNLSSARVKHQKKQMEEIAKRGICPFCREYFEEYHAAPILRERKYWLVTKNDYPYEGTEVHLLLVHKKHIEKVSQISKDGFIELLNHLSWIEKKFKIKGASFVLRSGDSEYTGASIAHLHAHLVLGSKQKKSSVPIKVKIGFFINKKTVA